MQTQERARLPQGTQTVSGTTSSTERSDAMNLQSMGSTSGGIEQSRRSYAVAIASILLALTLGVAGAWHWAGRGATSTRSARESGAAVQTNPNGLASNAAVVGSATRAGAYYLVATQAQAETLRGSHSLGSADEVLVAGSPAAITLLANLSETNKTREANDLLPISIVDMHGATALPGEFTCIRSAPEQWC